MYQFNLIGKLKEINSEKLKGYEENNLSSGWKSQVIRFNVVADHNSILVQSKALYKEGNDIYTMLKGEGKYVKGRIPWDKRLDNEVVKTVSPFKTFIIDLNKEPGLYNKAISACKLIKESGCNENLLKNWKVKDKEELLEVLKNILSKHYVYICEHDFINKIKEIISDSQYANAKFLVKGSSDSFYSENKQEYYDSNIVNRIQLVEEEKEEQNNGNVVLFYDNQALVKSDDKWVINAYHEFYDVSLKRKCFSPFKLIYYPETGDDEVSKKKNSIIEAWFKKPEGNKLMEIGVNFKIINSAQREEIKIEDLPEETKELIAIGLISLEELQKENGNQYGERLREFRFTGLSHGYGMGPKSTTFETADLERTTIHSVSSASSSINDSIWSDLI